MEEDRVYTISIGMKIFYGLLACFIFLMSIVFFSMGKGKAGIIILLFPISFLTTSVLIVINLFKRKVIISDSGITNINVFLKRELIFADIKGCRIGGKAIILEPVSENHKRILIGNYSDLGDSEQLAAWIKENFKDLDAADLKQDEEAVLYDTSLGYSEDDRKQKLKAAKQIAIAYNIIGPVISFVFLLLHNGFILVIIGMIYPLIAIRIMGFSHGLIKFLGNSKRSVIPFIVIGFMMPVIFLLVVSISDYQLFNYSHLWIYFGTISLIVFAFIYRTGLNKTISFVVGQTIFMLVISLIYSYGSVLSINCAFDNSEPKIYIAKVLNHRVESGKHTSYLFTLSQWGPMHEEKEEDVGKWIYDNVQIGDSVRIYFRNGKLQAPWYNVHSFAYKGK